MKSEQRHELEKNVLADRIGNGIESAKPMLPIIFGTIAVVVVLALGWGWYSSVTRGQAAVAWTDYYFSLDTSNDPASYFDLTARDAEAFLEVADKFPSSPAGKWAFQTAGGRFLEQGIEALYRNRAEGEKLLNQAIESFEAATDSSEPVLQTKAHYGLGRAYEALSKLSEASKEYQQVVEKASYEGLKEDAQKRLDYIASEDGKKFYAWFATLDPKPDAPIRLPSDLSTPPTSPGDMSFDPLGSIMPPTSAADGTVVTPGTTTETPVVDPAAPNNGIIELSPPTGTTTEPTSSSESATSSEPAVESTPPATQP